MATVDYFCEKSLSAGLKGKTVRGGIITGAAQGVKILVSLATVAIIGWLLDPEDNGLVAMVTVVTGLAGIFVDAGLSMATVQRQKITHAQVSNLFWIAATIGLGISLIVAALAPVLSWFYGEPRLTAITLAFSCAFFINGLSIQHQALLCRGMQFKQIAIADIVSSIAGLAVAATWAFTHYEQPSAYWALVLMPLSASLVRLLLVWFVCPWRPSLPKRGVGTKELVHFGANLTGASFVNYFSRNADNFLIGWWWGPTQLGLYAMAYKLLLWPLQQILGPISAVAIPALSRLQSNPEAYRNFFRKGVMFSSFVLVPIVFASIVLAPDLVSMLPTKWGGILPVFWALGPAALMATTAPASHWVYVSWGHTKQLFGITIVNSICMILGFASALQYGPFWVAVSFSVVTCLIRIPNILLAFRPTPLAIKDLTEPMQASFISAIAAVGGVLLMNWACPLESKGMATLLIGGVTFSVSYLLCMSAFPSGKYCYREAFRLVRSHRMIAPVNHSRDS